MSLVDFRLWDSVWIRRSLLLSVVMKLPCSVCRSLWFLLLLGAGSLLLLARLQNLTETLQRQTPGTGFCDSQCHVLSEKLPTSGKSTLEAEKLKPV